MKIKANIPFLVAMSFFILVRSTFANYYIVPSGSMEPTIAIGDRIFVNRVAYDLKVPLTNIILKNLDEPKRGDIVVFESPVKPGLTLVKRLVALPGDDVLIENGFLFINGKPGEFENHVKRIPEYFRPESRHFIVPEGQYFMMGDNRDNSADGRVFGFVKRELLMGRASRVLFSVDLHQNFSRIVAWNRIGKSL
ncbi:MAG: signal peptidase I [Xanthomonadaceae bacterium]|nr:signal peptidase I [Xanthomonadaceae bacterium]